MRCGSNASVHGHCTCITSESAYILVARPRPEQDDARESRCPGSASSGIGSGYSILESSWGVMGWWSTKSGLSKHTPPAKPFRSRDAGTTITLAFTSIGNWRLTITVHALRNRDIVYFQQTSITPLNQGFHFNNTTSSPTNSPLDSINFGLQPRSR